MHWICSQVGRQDTVDCRSREREKVLKLDRVGNAAAIVRIGWIARAWYVTAGGRAYRYVTVATKATIAESSVECSAVVERSTAGQVDAVKGRQEAALSGAEIVCVGRADAKQLKVSVKVVIGCHAFDESAGACWTKHICQKGQVRNTI